MSDEQFLTRLAQAHGSYKLRDQTAAQVRDILRKYQPQEVTRFIEALNAGCPNLRGLVFDTAGPQSDLEIARRMRNHAAGLLALLSNEKSFFVAWAYMDIESRYPDLMRSLIHVKDQAGEWIAENTYKRTTENGKSTEKQDGRDISRNVFFVAIIAAYWRQSFLNEDIQPHGDFKQVCDLLVDLESLPFNVTRTAIKKGLSLNLY